LNENLSQTGYVREQHDNKLTKKGTGNIEKLFDITEDNSSQMKILSDASFIEIQKQRSVSPTSLDDVKRLMKVKLRYNEH